MLPTCCVLYQAIERRQPQVQSDIGSLYETTNLLSRLLSLPTNTPNEFEQKVEQVCVNRWETIRAKLQQVKL